MDNLARELDLRSQRSMLDDQGWIHGKAIRQLGQKESSRDLETENWFSSLTTSLFGYLFLWHQDRACGCSVYN